MAPERRVASARILIVEDDDVNRFVVAEKVKALGYFVLLARNGWEAVQVVTNESVHAVLMDCQMPVMDGCAAAREIRKLGGVRAQVPIIALTANAHDSERDKVLAAGMNAFLTKPVRDAQLASTLQRQLAVAAEAKSDAPNTGDASADLPELDAQVARSAQVIALCLRLWPEQLHALGQAERTGDFVTMRAQAHKLKGGAGSVGAVCLAAATEALLQTNLDERDVVAEALARVLRTGERACTLLREEGLRPQSAAGTALRKS
jgi:CheY-like chemotaxis protein/HPt (histidine-containing phosphotransfer) domain-containing protein